MYSTSSGQRRGLLRPHSSSHSGPVFRNLPLFGFLAGLVLFFYIFYIYQAQNAELAFAREQNEGQTEEIHKLKTQLADTKALLEKQTRDSENKDKEVSEQKAALEGKLKDCSTLTENQKSDITKIESEKRDTSDKLQTVKSQMEQLNDTLSAMRTVNQNNEDTIRLLNRTIHDLQEQLQKAQSAPNQPAANIAASSNLNAENQDVIRQRIMAAKNAAPPPVRELVREGRQEGGQHNNLEQQPDDLKDLEAANVRKEGNIAKTTVFVAQREADNNVIAPPIQPAAQQEQAAERIDANAGKRKDSVEKEREKNGDDYVDDGKSVILGKDYKNEAEEAELQAQEKNLKPHEEGVVDFENDDKKN